MAIEENSQNPIFSFLSYEQMNGQQIFEQFQMLPFPAIAIEVDNCKKPKIV